MAASKVAIIQCADTGPLESLVIMLRSIGYECRIPNDDIKRELRALKCGLVLDIASLVKGMGYSWPMRLPEATLADMACPDVVYVDVKAHQIYDKVTARWPNLKDRVLWYRINGGMPEHVIKPSGEDCGDEVNPPCPVLTPNQWYVLREGLPQPGDPYPGWAGRAYAVWPPFYRFDEYYPVHGRAGEPSVSLTFTPPVCLIHGVQGWGYGALIDNMRLMGVAIHGAPSPDGLIPHAKIPALLSRTMAMVHLKSSDAPGYAIYECIAAGCPLICTRRLIWRCRMQDLLIPGETCLVFDRETHDGLTPADVADCTREVAEHLERLRDPAENRRIGEAGRKRLAEVMWSESKPADVDSLRAFMERHYPN